MEFAVFGRYAMQWQSGMLYRHERVWKLSQSTTKQQPHVYQRATLQDSAMKEGKIFDHNCTTFGRQRWAYART